MPSPAVVLIHSQGNSEGPLREAIEHYMPQMVFLISNKEAADAPLIMRHLEYQDESKLGRLVRGVEHSEMILIDDAWSGDTVLQMFEAIDKAKTIAKGLANGSELRFYTGVAGGTKLMVIGSALAAIMGDITTYYVNKETIDRTGELLFEIEFLNDLMKVHSWINAHTKNKNNLRYLIETIRRESNSEITTALEISRTLSPLTDKSVRNAMRVLKEKGLIDYDSDISPQIYKSTLLGKYVNRIFDTQLMNDEV
tara:strand:- start:343 stop:1101 length:759 start_codon:yes stop_codon:yes gene_type:complete